MSAIALKSATLDDLALVEEKAELIGGRIVELMPTSRIRNRVAGRIFKSLDDRALHLGIGEAYTDNIGFGLPAPLASGRESFSPDASYFQGPFTSDPKKFIDGTPTFAVEVRSDSDSGAAGTRAMAEKRDYYFEAGTLAVWDVDPDTETIYLYTSYAPFNPIAFRLGDLAHAEPALPGWRLAVDAVFV